MLKIKDIKNAQVFYGKDSKGEYHSFKAFGDAFYVATSLQGTWCVECTDSGDYCYTFEEVSEEHLYPAEYEQRVGRVSGKTYTIAVPPKE